MTARFMVYIRVGDDASRIEGISAWSQKSRDKARAGSGNHSGREGQQGCPAHGHGGGHSAAQGKAPSVVISAMFSTREAEKTEPWPPGRKYSQSRALRMTAVEIMGIAPLIECTMRNAKCKMWKNQYENMHVGIPFRRRGYHFPLCILNFAILYSPVISTMVLAMVENTL